MIAFGKAGNYREHAALSFPSFLAWVCDAQDQAAIRRASVQAPIDCAVRFEGGVSFLRPLDVGACVDPKREQARKAFGILYIYDYTNKTSASSYDMTTVYVYKNIKEQILLFV